MYKIIFTEPAVADLNSSMDYILNKLKAPEAAKRNWAVLLGKDFKDIKEEL